MEQQSEKNNQPDLVSVGAALRAGREAAGLSLHEVAERLKLTMRQLEAIERDEFSVLPGATFVRGFVRNYARFLEIDPTPLMEALDAHFHFPSAATEVVNFVREREDHVDHSSVRGGGTWLVVGLVAVVLGASALWIFGRGHSSTPDLAPVVGPQTALDLAAAVAPVASIPVAPAAVAVVANPVASTPLPEPVAVTPALEAVPVAAASAPLAKLAAVDASAAAVKAAARAAAKAARVAARAKTEASRAAARAASGPEVQLAPATVPTPASAGAASAGHVAISVTEPVRVAVVDGGGKRLVYSLVVPGSPRQVSGRLPLKVRVGNVDKVALSYNGKPVDLANYASGSTASLELE